MAVSFRRKVMTENMLKSLKNNNIYNESQVQLGSEGKVNEMDRGRSYDLKLKLKDATMKSKSQGHFSDDNKANKMGRERSYELTTKSESIGRNQRDGTTWTLYFYFPITKEIRKVVVVFAFYLILLCKLT